MTVTEDELITGYGENVTFGIVHKEPAVIVIPWDGQNLTMIKQYRYAVNYEGWEFPAGHHEHSSLIETARAELREEAGLVAGSIKKIGEFHIAPGHMTQVCHVYLATKLSHVSRELERAEKGMLVSKFSKSEIMQMLQSGNIKDGVTICAFKYLELLWGK